MQGKLTKRTIVRMDICFKELLTDWTFDRQDNRLKEQRAEWTLLVETAIRQIDIWSKDNYPERNLVEWKFVQNDNWSKEQFADRTISWMDMWLKTQLVDWIFLEISDHPNFLYIFVNSQCQCLPNGMRPISISREAIGRLNIWPN